LLLLNKQLNIKARLDNRPALLDSLHNYDNYSNVEENGKL